MHIMHSWILTKTNVFLHPMSPTQMVSMGLSDLRVLSGLFSAPFDTISLKVSKQNLLERTLLKKLLRNKRCKGKSWKRRGAQQK